MSSTPAEATLPASHSGQKGQKYDYGRGGWDAAESASGVSSQSATPASSVHGTSASRYNDDGASVRDHAQTAPFSNHLAKKFVVLAYTAPPALITNEGKSTSREDVKFTEGMVKGRVDAFQPVLQLAGEAEEGKVLRADVSMPNLMRGHPTVVFRCVVQWEQEELGGNRWLSDGEALARAAMRQRGFYDASHTAPEHDGRAASELRFLPIPGSSHTLTYRCRGGDIGRRIRVVLRPISSFGQVGEELSAISPEVLCSPPTFTGAWVHTAEGNTLRVSHAPDLAVLAQGDPCPDHLPNPMLGDTLNLVLHYIGGEAAEHSITWTRVGEVTLLRERPEELLQEQQQSYTITEADVGYQIHVHVVARRADGMQGAPRHLYTAHVSRYCPYTSRKHAHVGGVCPIALSYGQLASRAKGAVKGGASARDGVAVGERNSLAATIDNGSSLSRTPSAVEVPNEHSTYAVEDLRNQFFSM